MEALPDLSKLDSLSPFLADLRTRVLGDLEALETLSDLLNLDFLPPSLAGDFFKDDMR